MYFVACTLNASTNTATLNPSGSQLKVLDSDKHPTDEAWSTFSPGGDMDLTAIIATAMVSDVQSLFESTYCLPLFSMTMEIWEPISVFTAYVTSLLGMGVSVCNASEQYSSGPTLSDYAGTPSLLTRSEMEHVVSRIATEFMWMGKH
ncbi:hypothetical protein L210DRAFT_553792 [Boletus edulis BED1]|uniref:Uncharacterized protein n=1 Tax=Boletus edulis BED1 TaxID=1328754 RepID=A0AAD4C5E5_BOLED|nr:hypothetical protein L210DRAFT_553792 [Boletus edulis BED1]